MMDEKYYNNKGDIMKSSTDQAKDGITCEQVASTLSARCSQSNGIHMQKLADVYTAFAEVIALLKMRPFIKYIE